MRIVYDKKRKYKLSKEIDNNDNKKARNNVSKGSQHPFLLDFFARNVVPTVITLYSIHTEKEKY